jgi:hypothetical protein
MMHCDIVVTTIRQFIFFAIFFEMEEIMAKIISFQPVFFLQFFNLQNICHTNVIELKCDAKFSDKTF